jgi:hypothetical protein
MENVHVIPTNKPSRLWINNLLQGKLELSNDILVGSNTAQNIYITSDEEIKEGDSVILKSGRLTKAELRDGTLGFQTIDGIAFLYFREGDKKIILTTDQDLIKDGVQAIEDEFLKWFVKNPSCEKVEVKKGFEDGSAYGYNFLDYKIIIPKEEPKQETLGKKEIKSLGTIQENRNSGFYKQEIFKQETLEEAAEKYEDKITRKRNTRLGIPSQDFEAGAKWQAKRMYSEEDLREAFKQSRQAKIFEKDMPPVYESFEKWFEQFKKK